MSKKLKIKKKRLTKEQKEIEGLIKWLKIFYKSNEKEKNLILLKLSLKNKAVFTFVNQIKDIGEYDQQRLYKQLRMGLYNV